MRHFGEEAMGWLAEPKGKPQTTAAVHWMKDSRSHSKGPFLHASEDARQETLRAGIDAYSLLTGLLG